MGVVIRQSSLSGALTLLGLVLGYLNVLYLFPEFFSPSEFGLTRVIQDFSMLLVPFAQFGLSQATIRFFPAFIKTDDGKKGFLVLMVLLATASFLVFLVIFYLFRHPVAGIFELRAPEVNQYIILILVLTFILVINAVITDYTRSLLQIVIPNFLKEVMLRLLTTASIGLYIVGWVDFDGFLLCIVVAYLLNLVLLVTYLQRTGNFPVSTRLVRSVKLSEIKTILNYGFFALIGASGAMIISKVDVVMVTSMLGTESTAIYAMAFYMAVVIEIPRRVLTQITTPLISRALERGDMEEVRSLYQKSAINLFVIGTLLLIGLWANIDNIYALVPKNDFYAAGELVVVYVGIAKLIDMGAGLNGEIIILSKYYRVNIVLTGLLALITILANLILIPILGLVGAALGTLIALTAFNLVKFIFLKVKLALQPFSRAHIMVLAIGGSLLWLSLMIPQGKNVVLDIVVRSTTITLVYGLSVIALGVSDDVSVVWKGFLEFIRRKK